ncbi:MAG: DUF4249 family protein [Rikenellaceae bacterium]
MKRYITAFLIPALSMVVGCSKVIDIDYTSADPLYVAVSTLSTQGGSLLLTQSSAMDEPAQSDPITKAVVSVSGTSGDLYYFEPDADGIYQIDSDILLSVGDDYTLTIEVDDQVFTSTSHLYAAPEIADVSFSMQQFSSDMDLVFCTFSIMDQAGEENYYRYRFRYFANDNEESGEPDWSLTKETFDGEPITLMTHLYTMDRDLEDGDVITIEVQAIDKAVYDYLYTLNLSGSSATNPTSNFTGGCLGYFSAYSLSTKVTEFYYENAVSSGE